ncbi:conserved exported hypothetical protein [Luteimonas sp. 9C]|uniref:hypothetical protein n=1 Tax=Luteimonas sp. 9C TaxID=2653148 RepID=UPI0012F06C01|nr:hypothetical protein [Luteimonas sp. 9C]VXC01434.1 conserved exported hypothetical protein [Luteimonas sp. 9C]
MPIRSVLIALLLIAPVAPVLAQDAPAGTTAPADVAPSLTGDVWLDTWLADVDLYAGRYRGAFVDELVRYQSAPRAFVDELLAAGARPADVYLACATARSLGRTCREIIAEWRRDPAAGWRGVLDRLDAGPGTETFVRVRRGLVSSFDRWARPIRLDAALRRAFPDRAD